LAAAHPQAIPTDAGQSKDTDPLVTLQQLCRDDMASVNALILQQMQSDVSLIPQIAGHIVAAGGKRLRPMLTIASARLCDYQGDAHIGLAATVEFIHTATLLHDDVVDESGLRRGANTANAVWGNKASVLVGDFLFSRAFLQMVHSGSLEILEILSKASAVIAEGEVHQLVTANDISTNRDQYLQVVTGKTAALFAAACQIGGVVADRPPAQCEALRQFGLNLGIAFQLVDDCLDYGARQDELGKALGDDFRDGKITLPVILAIENADETELTFWRRTLEDLEQTDADFAHALKLIDKYGALTQSLDQARSYVLAAQQCLAEFEAGPFRDALFAIARSSVDRAS